MKRAATILLLLVAAIYIVARAFEHAQPWLAWVRAFSEAAMVGALADWFAVVALFRHPLGIPIPHTAILRHKKEEIGATLAGFVVGNFLNRDVVAARLAGLDLAAFGAGWIEAQASEIATRLAGLVPWALDAADDEDVARLLHAQVTGRLRDLSAAPFVARFLRWASEEGNAGRLLQETLGVAGRVVREHRELIRTTIRSEIPLPERLAGVPVLGAVKDQVAGWMAGRVVDRVERLLGEAAENPTHPLRQALRDRVGKFINDLEHDPGHRARLEALKIELIGNEAVAGFARTAWSGIKQAIRADFAQPDSPLRTKLAGFVRDLASAIRRDEPVRTKLNLALRAAIPDLIEAHRDQARQLIEETVRAWDGREMAAKIESAVGRDLQFIRINGTLIGGLVGVGLHAIGRLVWPG